MSEKAGHNKQLIEGVKNGSKSGYRLNHSILYGNAGNIIWRLAAFPHTASH